MTHLGTMCLHQAAAELFIARSLDLVASHTDRRHTEREEIDVIAQTTQQMHAR